MSTHRPSRHEKPELGDFKKAGSKTASRPKAGVDHEVNGSTRVAEKSKLRAQLSL